MYIFLLTILSIILRLINIDKPEGLWNDEYVSWFIASKPFFDGFWQEVLKQCHLPLYYFYLKPFSACNDLVLRLTSVLPAVLSVPIMYFVGREFSKKNGFICALVTSVLPFLIYYSQEVRFYSLLFCFSTLSLLFTIRLIKGKNAWLGYCISSLLILFTHVLGGIYVGLNFGYILYRKRKVSLKLVVLIILTIFILLPFGINIFRMLPSSQWWGTFSYTNILFLFTDYFSPILTNHVNAPPIFFYSHDWLHLFLMIFPTCLALLSIILGFKQERGLFVIAFGVVIITAFLAITGKIVFITKYTIEILPILILLFSLGIKGKWGNILLSIFVSIQLFSIVLPYHPVNKYRVEGHKLVANILNSQSQDVILFTYYDPIRFLRYLDTNAKMVSISKTYRFDYERKPEEILDFMTNGDKVSIVFLDSVSFIPAEMLESAKQNNIPEMFLTFSKIRVGLLEELAKNYSDIKIARDGSWTVVSAVKY